MAPEFGDHRRPVPEHRRLAGGAQLHEAVAPLPRSLGDELDRNPLLGALEADLAAERTEREVMELPHAIRP